MKVPKHALLFKNTDEGSVEILAEGDEKNRFRLVGNSGKPFQHEFFGKLIIDFENLKLRKSPLVILREHDTLLVAGTARRTKELGELVFEGEFSKVTDTAKELKELLSEGVKFESSIRVDPKSIDFLEDKETAEVNGQTVKGPMRIFRDNLVSEASFALFGVDKKTSGKLVAAEGDETINIIENRKGNTMTDQNTSQITEEQLAEAQKTAAKNEQARITSIMAELPGEELAEVRNKAIADSTITLVDAKAMAFNVVQKARTAKDSQGKTDLEIAQTKLAAIAAGGENLSGQEANEIEAGDNASQAKADSPGAYLAEFNRLQTLGKSGAESVRLAAAKYPDSHTEWVRNCPTSPKPL